jgi:hypothetical protein
MNRYNIARHPVFQRFTGSDHGSGNLDRNYGPLNARNVQAAYRSSGLMFLIAAILLTSGICRRADARILDITIPQAGVPKACPLVMGTARNPHGDMLSINRQCVELNGKPWIPVAGEFHYVRYPRRDWLTELRKMKAGGINVVSTYVFWIYQEEQKGVWDWRGRRDLRAFLEDCQKVGLLAVVRMGPWDHGEVRNGGFPNWVQHSGVHLRSNDPRFIAMVKPLYRQIARQMRGLLWKNGGPVIAVQMDNECGDLPYLYHLKQIARKYGVDVPFYNMTGWNNVAAPNWQLLPMFGAYPDGFWTNAPHGFVGAYHFSPVRSRRDARQFNRFPYVCCEIGGGMASSYAHRIWINGNDIGALSLAELADGSVWQGYYMYQGGWDLRGKLSYLNETLATQHYNDMPYINYDFQAPLGACGQERPQYNLLREQALFLHDFGTTFALMPTIMPKHVHDGFRHSGLIWDVRSNGTNGYIFFNNYQYEHPLPAKHDIQFALHEADGTVLIPAKPITIPAGSYGWWPVNLNCHGILVRYATVEPICHVQNGRTRFYIFGAIKGIAPRMAIAMEHGLQLHVTAGTMTRRSHTTDIAHFPAGLTTAVRAVTPGGERVKFIVLTASEAQHLWKIRVGSVKRAIISKNMLIPTHHNLKLQRYNNAAFSLAILPTPAHFAFAGKDMKGRADGAFKLYTDAASVNTPAPITWTLRKRANMNLAAKMYPMIHNNWNTAAVTRWQVHIPRQDRNLPLMIKIHYIGNVLRVYAGGKLLVDDFYNGKPLDFPLDRVPAKLRGRIELRMLPLFAKSPVTLPAQARPNFRLHRAYGEIKSIEPILESHVTCTVSGDPIIPEAAKH